jgi:hypothetical protein
MMDKVSLENRVFELVSYIAVSACNLLEEPARYGPFRLVDTASRLIEIIQEYGIDSPRLDALHDKIEDGKYTAMAEEEDFKAFLESLVTMLVEQIEENPV